MGLPVLDLPEQPLLVKFQVLQASKALKWIWKLIILPELALFLFRPFNAERRNLMRQKSLRSLFAGSCMCVLSMRNLLYLQLPGR